MTDTFASKSSAPSGPSSELGQPSGDLTVAFAELERKLRELEQEVSSIGRRSTASEPPPSSEAHSSSQVAPAAPASTVKPPMAPTYLQPSGRLVDEAVEPPTPVEPTATPERARPSEAQLASLAELRRFRDRLERFGRELAAEYDALLGRVMTGLSSTSTPSASTPAAPSPAASTPAPAPAPPPAMTAAEAQENALFEGRVELGVGPFYDIASLGAFERSLAALPGVSEASVRRFEASHAVVDVHLSAPVALVRELRRAGDSGFSVREVASGRILLTFDDA